MWVHQVEINEKYQCLNHIISILKWANCEFMWIGIWNLYLYLLPVPFNPQFLFIFNVLVCVCMYERHVNKSLSSITCEFILKDEKKSVCQRHSVSWLFQIFATILIGCSKCYFFFSLCCSIYLCSRFSLIDTSSHIFKHRHSEASFSNQSKC